MNGNVLKEPVVISIAEKLGKTPAQVALRWNIQMGHSVLPKSVSEDRIKQNLDVYDWSIPDNLLAKFSEIKQVSYATLFWFFRQLLALFCLCRLLLPDGSYLI
jgi:diketogulonate reductase-like aldo/keto reductase